MVDGSDVPKEWECSIQGDLEKISVGQYVLTIYFIQLYFNNTQCFLIVVPQCFLSYSKGN